MPRTKPPLGARLDGSSSLSKGLVGCWLLNEGGGVKVQTIGSVKALTGTLTNIANPSTATSGWKPGPFGTTVRFDGSNDYISVANGSALLANDLHTVSLWFTVTSVVNTPMLWSSNASSNEAFLEIGLATTLIWGYRNTIADATKYRTYTIPTIATGWHHVVCVKTGTTTGNLYLDGQLQTSFTGNFTSSTVNTTSSLEFAEYATSHGVIALAGALDNLRVYNRALAADEAMTLYCTPYAGVSLPRLRRYVKVSAATSGMWINAGHW